MFLIFQTDNFNLYIELTLKLLNSSKLLIDAISGKYSIDFNTDELPK